MKRTTLGLTEKATISNKKSNLEQTCSVRIDTGATKSSIDSKLASKLKLPIIKTTVVKSASGGSVVRPVVKATLNLHGKEIPTTFTLANRHHMKYKVLVGQNILKKGEFLIDPLIK